MPCVAWMHLFALVVNSFVDCPFLPVLRLFLDIPSILPFVCWYKSYQGP